MKKKSPYECGNCGRSAKEGRFILERMSGKASVYLNTPRWWCGRCRAVNHGKWKYHR